MFCIHNWSKWEEATAIARGWFLPINGVEVEGRMRTCEKCLKEEFKN